MTEEQLNKEAEEKYPNRENARFDEYSFGYLNYQRREAYKAGYRSRDKEVEELKDLVWRAMACGDYVFSLELNQIKRELNELKSPSEGR